VGEPYALSRRHPKGVKGKATRNEPVTNYGLLPPRICFFSCLLRNDPSPKQDGCIATTTTVARRQSHNDSDDGHMTTTTTVAVVVAVEDSVVDGEYVLTQI
jgi:hypothetical protein